MPFLTNVPLPQCLQHSSATRCLLARDHDRGCMRHLLEVKCLKSLTLSAVARPIFLKGLQSDIDLQYGAMLEPIIARAIKHETRSLRALLMLVLTRIAFDSGQTRAITTNILARQPGITQEQLDEVLDKSGDTALANITRITPQISTGMQSINTLLGVTKEVHGRP